MAASLSLFYIEHETCNKLFDLPQQKESNCKFFNKILAKKKF